MINLIFQDNQEEVTADGGEVTEGDKKTEEPASTEETEKGMVE